MKINEIYGPTIQGEGKSVGKEVLFIRTAGCNLACVWCDTPFTWNWLNTKFEHPDKFDPKKEVHEMSDVEIINRLKELGNTKAVVISGGEPMLQQRALVGLLTKLKRENYWVEIETNGTVRPTEEFYMLIDQINCSPKLTNAGRDNPEDKRIIESTLLSLASCPKTTFKFVVSSEEDIPEILNLTLRFQMNNVYLMPLGKTLEEQELRQAQVEELGRVYGFKFSPRLHILKWGNKRGV